MPNIYANFALYTLYIEFLPNRIMTKTFIIITKNLKTN